jgi:D-3-phosphoglycerate dehydrogenase
MKPDALLINTSRGPIIDEAALAEALSEKKLGGAGLDVLEKEPPEETNPLLVLDNVIVTPHTAALTHECVIRMATEAARCVLDVFVGKEPPNMANPAVLAHERWADLIPRQV